MKQLPGVLLSNILTHLNDYNDIKYVAYRTAAKLRHLQTSFNLDKLPVDVLGGVLIQHHLSSTENSVTLTTSELTSLLEDLYFVIGREYESNIDVEYSADLLCRFVIQVLQREDGVELLSLKIVLAALSGSKPRDKYNYLFSQLCDHNNILTHRRLELLLQRLVLLTTFVGEVRSFGRPLIPGTVKSCFQDQPSGSLGVSLDVFTIWLTKDPQLLVWISTLHRVNLADSIVHDVKCAVCKTAPISGLRYRCLRCLTYNLCQSCFFYGRTSRNHKVNHPVQEYCYQSTAKQSLWALLATLHNKLKRNGWKLQYLPAESRESYMEESTLKLDQLEETTKTSPFSINELESVIVELEEHSKRLVQGLNGAKQVDMKNMILNQRSLVEKQVERLRALKVKLESRRMQGHGMVNSTPCSRVLRRTRLDPISPITSNNLTLTWDKYDMGIAEEEASCVVTWDEGSSSSESLGQATSSHTYTWLQNTVSGAESSSKSVRDSRSTKEACAKEVPEDIKHLQADLDVILDKLQELLASHSDEPSKESQACSKDSMGDIMERL